MNETFRDDLRRPKGDKRKPVRLFLEELEGRCLLSHPITPIGALTSAPDGSIWFLEPDRLGRIDPSTGVIQEFAIGTPTSASNGFGAAVAPIVAGPDGSIWFLSNNQVARFEPGSGSVEKFDVPGTLTDQTLAIGPDGNVWVGEYQVDQWDLVRIYPDTGAVQVYVMGQNNNEGDRMGSNSIAIGSDGRVWALSGWAPVGGAGGEWTRLQVLNPATGSVQQIEWGFPLQSIIAESNGSIGWVGVYQWYPPTGQVLNLGFDALGPIHEDMKGNIWSSMAYWPGRLGIAEFDPTTGKVVSFPVSSAWWIFNTFPDAQGQIWFTTSNEGVGRLDPATGNYELFDQAVDLPSPSPSNPPPAAGTTINATAGIDFITAVATFTPQTPIPSSGAAYQATVDWGDGTTSSLVFTVTANGTYDVTAGHTYQTAGTFSIRVTIGNYDPANPLGDNAVTVFSTANVNDPFKIAM